MSMYTSHKRSRTQVSCFNHPTKKKPILLAIPLPTGGRNATKAENLLPFRNIEKLEKPHFLSTIANLRATARLESCWRSTHICDQRLSLRRERSVDINCEAVHESGEAMKSLGTSM